MKDKGSIIPKFNSNIEFVRIEDSLVLCVQEKYGYRVTINIPTYNLISLIDGNKKIKNIVSEFNTKYDDCVSIDDVYNVLNDKLKKFGIVDMGDSYKVEKHTPSYLRLRIDLITNKQSSYVTRYLKWLFGMKYFWITFSLLNLTVYSLFVIFVEDIYHKLVEVNILDAIIIIFLMGIALLAHELGHASACDRFGAHHGNIGFGFYLFTPVMYADVSDIWRLPQKERMIVNLAGIYMGNFMALVFFLIYLYTESSLYLYAFSIQSLEGLYNLNPLVKYDGYWVLSDLIKVPNLSRTAYEKLHDFSLKQVNLYSKKEWLLLGYAIISPIFIVTYIIFILLINPESLLYFPRDFLMFVFKSILDIKKINFFELANFTPQLIFYYLIIKMVVLYIKKRHFSMKLKCEK